MMFEFRSVSRCGAIMFACVTLAGCGGGDVAATVVECTNPPNPPNQGDLVKTLTDYSQKELMDLAGTYGWSNSVHGKQIRKCGAEDCEGAIVAINAVKFGTAAGQIGACGTILARMEVDPPSGGGNPKEDVYEMIPGHAYLMVGMPEQSAGAGPTWALVEIVGKTGSNQKVTVHKSGPLTLCNNETHKPDPTTVAMFRHCDQQLTTAGQVMAAPRVDDPKSPAWMSCELGCCTAGY